MANYTRILSIDGGGIRGIIPGMVLVRLEEKLKLVSANPQAAISDYFDLFAGTSTGGILSCAHLIPADKNSNRPKYSAQEIVNLYFEKGKDIFDLNLAQKIRSGFGISDEKYNASGIEKALQQYMGNTQLSELIKPCVITAYDIEHRKTVFFTQHSAIADKRKDFYVKDVCRSTSAAPTYFECARIQNMKGENFALVDGGLFANNPTLCAYAEARKIFKKPFKDKGVTAEDMMILSIGTGDCKKIYPYEKAKDRGLAAWVKPLIDIMMSGVAETVDYQVQKIYEAVEAERQYLRIDTTLMEGVNPDMDDASEKNLEALRIIGANTADLFDKQLEQFARMLVGDLA